MSEKHKLKTKSRQFTLSTFESNDKETAAVTQVKKEEVEICCGRKVPV